MGGKRQPPSLDGTTNAWVLKNSGSHCRGSDVADSPIVRSTLFSYLEHLFYKSILAEGNGVEL